MTLVRDVALIRRAVAAASTPSSGPRTMGVGRLLEPTTCVWGDDDDEDESDDDSDQESDEAWSHCCATARTATATTTTRGIPSSSSSTSSAPSAFTAATAPAASIHVHENDDDPFLLPPPRFHSRRAVVVVRVESHPAADPRNAEVKSGRQWGCRRRQRQRPVWSTHEEALQDKEIQSVVATAAPRRSNNDDADVRCFALECVQWTLPAAPTDMTMSSPLLVVPSPSKPSTMPSACLVELHLVQCDLHSLQAIQAVSNLEALRIVDCHVTNVPAQEWTTCLSHLVHIKTLRLEALEFSNSSLHSIAVGLRHVSDSVSIGPLYNDRQFFPALRTVVQMCQAQKLELFGGGTKDSNLIHIVNGLLPMKQRRPKQQKPDAASGVSSSIRSLTIQNYAGGSKATLTKLLRAVHYRSSRKDVGLRRFALSLAINDADVDGSTFTSLSSSSRLVDRLPLVALIQSDTYLESLSIEPSLVVDSSWKVPLLRAMQRNTHLFNLEGFVSDHDSSDWSNRLQQYLDFNRCGRAAIKTATCSPALWPTLLHHVVARNRSPNDPNPLLYFVREYCVGASEAVAARRTVRENA